MPLTTRRTQSCGACDMFRRRTSTPRWTSWVSISAEFVAGSSVAMILVLRKAAIGFVRFKWPPSFSTCIWFGQDVGVFDSSLSRQTFARESRFAPPGSGELSHPWYVRQLHEVILE